MRANHGKHSKNKGSAFEREAGKQLSLWLTAGERPDTFSRNVLSGGSFTNAELRGEKSSRMPGDLMAAHPLAFAFLSQFSVECKHYEDIGLDAYLWDTRARTMLGEFIYHTKRQALPVNLDYMLVAKQDYRDALVFVSSANGKRFLAAKRESKRTGIIPMYHLLHKESVFVMRLEDMISYVDPDKLLQKEKR